MLITLDGEAGLLKVTLICTVIVLMLFVYDISVNYIPPEYRIYIKSKFLSRIFMLIILFLGYR